jgi:hypothetical protein
MMRTTGVAGWPKVFAAPVQAGEVGRAYEAYGMFSIIYAGRLIADRPIGATGFMNTMRRDAGQPGRTRLR